MRQAPPPAGPSLTPAIGRRARGRGRAGAGGACGGRPRFSLPPSCGCGPGCRAGRAALGFPRRLPRPPWATHTTRGRPQAAPGPAASGGSGGRRSGRQVGAGGGGGAGGEEGLPAAAAAAAAAPSWGLLGVSLGGRESPAQTPPLTCRQRHMYARIPAGGHMYMFTIYSHIHNTHSDVWTCRHKNHIHFHTHTIAVGGTDPEIQVHIPMYTVYPATRTPPQSQIQTHSCRYSCPTS